MSSNSNQVITIDFEDGVNNSRDYRKPNLTQETLSLIGPATKGPAFVPTLVNEFGISGPGLTLNTFENIFGEESKNYFETPTIANIWFTGGGRQLSYTRVLGLGDGLSKDELTGLYSGSGFVVGQKNVTDSVVLGKIGNNNKAQTAALGQNDSLALGRTYFFCNRYTLRGTNSGKIFSNYLAHQYGNLEHSEEFYLVDKVFLTQQGIKLTLNPYYFQSNLTQSPNNVDFRNYFRNSNYGLINSDLKNITVKSDVSYGNTATDFLGGFISYDIGNNSHYRILINGLNNREYNRIQNIIRFENYVTSEYVNYYGNELSISNDFINKSFKRLNDRGYIEYANFLDVQKNISSMGNYSILMHSKLNHNEIDNENNIPSYEDFQSIYKKAKTPWVVSQHIYGLEDNNNTSRVGIEKNCKELFRFHACDDGEIGNRFRIRIKPKKLGIDYARPKIEFEEEVDIWSTFDIIVSEYDHKKNSFTTLMNVTNANLNPDSKNYICRLFGTRNTYYDIENNKIVDEGFYEKTNQYLFVEVHPDVEDKLISCELMPSGFYSYPYLNVENNSLVSDELLDLINTSDGDRSHLLRNTKIFQKPVDYVRNLKFINNTGEISSIDDKEYYWGVQFNNCNQNLTASTIGNISKNVEIIGQESSKEIKANTFRYPNHMQDSTNFIEGNTYLSPYYEYTKWFQDSRSDINVWVEDENNNYLNSFFHLEKILYIKDAKSLDDKYRFSTYRRDGKSIQDLKTEHTLPGDDAATIEQNAKNLDIIELFRYVNINDLLRVESRSIESENSKFLKFDFFTYGGFDGLNCVDYDKKLMNGDAVIRELEDEAESGSTNGPTYNMYSKALDITAQYENTDCDILCVPGIRHPKFIREIYELTEDKDRFISIVDIPRLDSQSNYITGSLFEESYEDNENSKLNDPEVGIDFPDNDRGDIIEKVINIGTDVNPVYTSLREINEEGTTSTFNFFNKFNFESSKMFAVYNDVITEYRAANNKFKERFVLPPSSLAINSFAKTHNVPQINIDQQDSAITSNRKFDFTGALNLNLLNESNEKDLFLRLTESYGINAIGRSENNLNGNISFNSANSLKEDRRSLFRSINNVRILNRIKKSLKFKLYGAGGGDDILLFNNNFTKDNIYKKLQSVIEETLQVFVEEGSLRNFKVDLGKNSIINQATSDTISCKIMITFNGKKNNEDLTSLQIDSIISNIDQLIESFNENIIIVRT